MSSRRPSDVRPSEKLVREVRILNRFGIHARPAALFVKTAGKFACEVTVQKDETSVSGKSIMGLLTIEAHQGTVLRLLAEGPEAARALDALQELVEKKKFNEE